MNIHDLFEIHHSEQTGIDIQSIKNLRMSNGSYGSAHVSTCFRNFKSGFESNNGEKMKNAFEYEQEIKGLREELTRLLAVREIARTPVAIVRAVVSKRDGKFDIMIKDASALHVGTCLYKAME